MCGSHFGGCGRRAERSGKRQRVSRRSAGCWRKTADPLTKFLLRRTHLGQQLHGIAAVRPKSSNGVLNHLSDRKRLAVSARDVTRQKPRATVLLLRTDNCEPGLCVPKTSSELMMRRNRLSWWNDRAALFRSGRPGLAIQVELAT
jgi:hypothetical protein